MTLFSVPTSRWRLICGCASICISCEMMVDVCMPLTRPSTVVTLVILAPPVENRGGRRKGRPEGGRQRCRPPSDLYSLVLLYCDIQVLGIQVLAKVSPEASGRPAATGWPAPASRCQPA